MQRIFSGIQPTGNTHLGNYFGAVRNWVGLQQADEAIFCVVDLHSLTIPGDDPAELRGNTLYMTAVIMAAGIDPSRSILFAQSQVPAHTQLTWLLECTASVGEMGRMTQFKDKSAKGGAESARVGLFTYPILMAADILLYQTTHVPVGDDQRQHLELARDLAIRFNTRYGQVFTVPDGLIPKAGEGARLMDLQEPTKKMSKSAESDAGVIMISDPDKVIERKIKRAVTDADDGPDAVRYDRAAKPGVSSLLELLALCNNSDPVSEAANYTRYGDLKKATAEAVIETVRPIRQRYTELLDDPGHLQAVLAEGAARAGAIAEPTLRAASQAIGLLNP